MKLVWTAQALDDIVSVYRYIAADDATAAKRIVDVIRTSVAEILSVFPEAGRRGRIEGTRELVIKGTPFIVPYSVGSDTITLLGVHHAARRWPPVL